MRNSRNSRSENLIPLAAEDLSIDWDAVGAAIVKFAPNFPRRYLGPEFWNGILHVVVWSPVFYRKEHAIERLSKEKAVLVLLLTQLPTAYGAVHLVPWNFAFASNVEEVFWKIAALIILGGFNASVVLAGCRYCFFQLLAGCRYCFFRLLALFWASDAEEAVEAEEAEEAEEAGAYMKELHDFPDLCHTIDSLSMAAAFVCVVLYALSRIYLVAESFASLRHVPVGAYAAVPWIEDIPHI